MIVSPRIFITLLVPLLVHGAPTPSGNPPSYKWPPGDISVGGILPQTRPPSGMVLNDQVEISPAPPGYAPVQARSYGTNLDQPVNLHTAPLLPESPSAGGLPYSNTVHFTNDELHKQNRILVPEGTIYRRLISSPINQLMVEADRIETDRVAILPPPELSIVLLPKGTNVKISHDSDYHINVPTGLNTGIRRIDKMVELNIKEQCRVFHEKTVHEHGQTGLELLDDYVPRCSDINYWDIGSFKEVPVKRLDSSIIECKFPPHATYRIPPIGRTKPLRPSTRTQGDRVVTTLKGDVFFVRDGVKIIISEDPDDIPADNAKVQRVDKELERNIKKRCTDFYGTIMPPPGKKRKPLGQYVVRCSDSNYGHIKDGKLEFVPVEVQFMRKRVQQPASRKSYT